MKHIIYQDKSNYELLAVTFQSEKKTEEIKYANASTPHIAEVEANTAEEALTLSIQNGFAEELDKILAREAKVVQRQSSDPLRARGPGRSNTYGRKLRVINHQKDALQKYLPQ